MGSFIIEGKILGVKSRYTKTQKAGGEVPAHIVGGVYGFRSGCAQPEPCSTLSETEVSSFRRKPKGWSPLHVSGVVFRLSNGKLVYAFVLWQKETPLHKTANEQFGSLS